MSDDKFYLILAVLVHIDYTVGGSISPYLLYLSYWCLMVAFLNNKIIAGFMKGQIK